MSRLARVAEIPAGSWTKWLTTAYQVSRDTADRALAALADEGLTVPGRGTFVNPDRR